MGTEGAAPGCIQGRTVLAYPAIGPSQGEPSRSYRDFLVSELRSAREAIETTQPELLGEADARLVKRELQHLLDACLALGKTVQETEQARSRRPRAG